MKVIVDPRDRCEIQRRDFTTTVRVKPECGHATGGDVFNLVKDTSSTIDALLGIRPTTRQEQELVHSARNLSS